jgi:hypothetical protein
MAPATMPSAVAARTPAQSMGPLFESSAAMAVDSL